MTRRLKRICWVLIAMACVLPVASRFMREFPEVLLQLMVPYAFLAVGIALVRTDTMGRWAVGVSTLMTVMTFITAYEAPREFWRYLSLWVDTITVCQSVLAVLFLFGSYRQLLSHRRGECNFAEPTAPPNGGPAIRSGNSGASGGPPSVS